jgi:hypothetical protein
MPTKFTEELGTLPTEPLLQNIVLADPDCGMVDAIRTAFGKGFVVSAVWETVGALTEKEKEINRASFQLATNYDETLEALRSNKKFIELHLEPRKDNNEG